MFATFSRAITSRTAVALAGATTTGIALGNMYTYKDMSKEVYAKLLAEEGKVTELKAQLQRQGAALNAALDKLEAPPVATEKEELADLAIAAGSIVTTVGLAALFNARSCVGSCRELK